VIREFRKEDYGARGYQALDPENHVWYFGNQRAQAVHLVLFVGMPVLLGLLKLLLSIVLLPLLLLGFGDTNRDDSPSHLHEVGCWVALARCSVADKPLVDLPSPRAAGVAPADPQSAADAAEPFAEIPSAITLRHAWFLAWLVWLFCGSGKPATAAGNVTS
jgi:hypothetical protein